MQRRRWGYGLVIGLPHNAIASYTGVGADETLQVLLQAQILRF
jgi:hypothetical protein